MPGFTHILVPLDGHTCSDLALKAAETAVGKNGKLTLVRVADLVSDHHLPSRSDKQAIWSKQMEPVEAYLEACRERIQRTDLEIETVIASGFPSEAILDMVNDYRVDAVAMCRHSKSRLRKLLLGSTTQEVLSKCPVPVIIVHPVE
jgi:nucleotide-binding universal stress UspA family protein